MSFSDPEFDILQALIDYGKQAKAEYLESLRTPSPRFLVPAWLVEGWSQEQLDAYWLEAV